MSTHRVKRVSTPSENRVIAKRNHGAILFFLLLLFVTHALWLSHAQGFRVVDDAYISFRYLDNWLDGAGLVFNPGERVEGYSNLLWIIVLAPFRALGGDPVRISQALGLMAGLLTLLVTRRLTEAVTEEAYLGLLAMFLLALDGSFARWAIDGLETHLFTLLVTCAALFEIGDLRATRLEIRDRRSSEPLAKDGPRSDHHGEHKGYGAARFDRPFARSFGVGLVCGISTLVRPEGSMIFVLICMMRLWRQVQNIRQDGDELRPTPEDPASRSQTPSSPAGTAALLLHPQTWRHLFPMLLGFAFIVLPHLLWRHSFYGEWVPNTAHTKFHPGLVSLLRGLQYTYRFLAQHLGVLVGIVIILTARRAKGNSKILNNFKWLRRKQTSLQRTSSCSAARSGADSRPSGSAPAGLPLIGFLVLAYTAYVIFIGGDWMNRGRFFMPIAPLLALLTVEVVHRSWSAPASRRSRHAGSFIIVLLSLSSWMTSSLCGEWPRLEKAGEEHIGREAIIKWLNENAPPRSSLLTEEIGEIPYYTGLKTFDVYGLIDKHLARYGIFEPDAPAGHQVADLNYSLSLEPDFLVMADFEETFRRNTRPDAARVRYPALRQYELLPVRLPNGRLEIYERRTRPPSASKP